MNAGSISAESSHLGAASQIWKLNGKPPTQESAERFNPVLGPISIHICVGGAPHEASSSHSSNVGVALRPRRAPVFWKTIGWQRAYIAAHFTVGFDEYPSTPQGKGDPTFTLATRGATCGSSVTPSLHRNAKEAPSWHLLRMSYAPHFASFLTQLGATAICNVLQSSANHTLHCWA